jgi:hypothetical protein
MTNNAAIHGVRAILVNHGPDDGVWSHKLDNPPVRRSRTRELVLDDGDVLSLVEVRVYFKVLCLRDDVYKCFRVLVTGRIPGN